MRYRTGAAGEETPPPILVHDSDAVLLTGRRAFRSRDTSRISALVDEDRARHLRATDQVVVRHRRVPPTAGGVDPDEVVAEIGRASCRERVEISVEGGELEREASDRCVGASD